MTYDDRAASNIMNKEHHRAGSKHIFMWQGNKQFVEPVLYKTQDQPKPKPTEKTPRKLRDIFGS
jgi:hypothetical protein